MASGTVVAVATALGGGLLLLLAGLGHARRFGRLRAALAAQRIVPRRWQRPVAHGLVAAELTVGLGTLAAPLFPAVVFAVEAGIYAVLLAYAAMVRIRRPTAPCGCFGDDGPATMPVLARTAVLALGAGAAAALADRQPAYPPALLASLVAAAVVIAALARTVPALLSRPDEV